MMRDSSAPTAVKWEIRFRAALMLSCRDFYKCMATDAEEHVQSESVGWRFMLHQYRSDATNVVVWQRSKLVKKGSL